MSSNDSEASCGSAGRATLGSLSEHLLVMARTSSSASETAPEPAAKRLQTLQAFGHHTKSSTIKMLRHVQSTGALDGHDSERRLKQQMQIATESHSKSMTPYGPVVQSLQLDHQKLKHWELCHPFAYLYHMTRTSPAFSSIMHDCTRSGQPLRLVIYADELVLGSPFRPERSRTLQLIYWDLCD